MLKVYKHWLKIQGALSSEAKMYEEIQKYLDNHPDAKATIYRLDTISYFVDRIVLLECSENYDDLDLDVNGGGAGLRRLDHKPGNIIEPHPFSIPVRLKDKGADNGAND